MKSFFIIFIGMCFFVGCGDDWIAKIESDTTWIAECKTDGFVYKTVEGSGNKTIDLKNEEKVCVEVWKTTEEGCLKLTIINDNPGSWDSSEDSWWAKTCHPYGEIERCTYPAPPEDEY